MKIELSKIVLDKSIYPRIRVNEFNVARLEAAVESGAVLPPPVIEASTKRLVDGWHRYEVYKRNDVKRIEVLAKTYASEADIFADAVRLNVSHGQPLDNYSVRSAIIRLQEYGYKRDQISEVIRMPAARLEKIERGFATSPSGDPVALKGGLAHMGGATLTENQQETNRHYSGGKATFHVKQLCEILENDMWPQTEKFAFEMNRLVGIWAKIAAQRSAAA